MADTPSLIDVSGGHSLAGPEIRLLLSFKADHAYLVTEIVRGDSNARRYLTSLEAKGCVRIATESEYEYSGPTAYRSRIEKVWLTELGRRLRDALREVNALADERASRGTGLTRNDVKLLVSLLESEYDRVRLTELAKVAGLSVTTLYSVVARLASLSLVSAAGGEHSLTEDGRIVASALLDWVRSPPNRDVPLHSIDVGVSPPSPVPATTPDIDSVIIKCREILRQLLFVSADSQADTLLILTDGRTQHIGTLFGIAADLLNIEHTLLTMPVQNRLGELPKIVSSGLQYVTVLIAATSRSVTYAPAIADLVRVPNSRFRVASIPGPTLQFLDKTVITDPSILEAIRSKTESVAEVIAGSERMTITSTAGTRLRLSRKLDDRVVVELGSAEPPEAPPRRYPSTRSTNLVAGEVFFGHETASGVIAANYIYTGCKGAIDSPIFVEVKENKIVAITGHSHHRDTLEEMFTTYGIDELTSINIGCNEHLQLSGSFIADCKVAGNVNFGFGASSFIGRANKQPVTLGIITPEARLSLRDVGAELVLNARESRAEIRRLYSIH